MKYYCIIQAEIEFAKP